MTGQTEERPLLAVAHRGGNNLADLRAALDAGVDLVEADVHSFRGVLEMRHLKTLGTRLLWDRWELVRRRSAVLPTLPEVIEALGDEPRLMLDLKGLHRGLASDVATVLAEAAVGAKVTICTQHWWMLDAFAAHPDLRLLLSAGSRRGLRRLRARLRQRGADGVCVRIDLLTPSIVDELRGAAEIVLTWPVDTPEALQNARRLGVSGVISKNLDLLREVIGWR